MPTLTDGRGLSAVRLWLRPHLVGLVMSAMGSAQGSPAAGILGVCETWARLNDCRVACLSKDFVLGTWNFGSHVPKRRIFSEGGVVPKPCQAEQRRAEYRPFRWLLLCEVPARCSESKEQTRSLFLTERVPCRNNFIYCLLVLSVLTAGMSASGEQTRGLTCLLHFPKA